MLEPKQKENGIKINTDIPLIQLIYLSRVLWYIPNTFNLVYTSNVLINITAVRWVFSFHISKKNLYQYFGDDIDNGK